MAAASQGLQLDSNTGQWSDLIYKRVDSGLAFFNIEGLMYEELRYYLLPVLEVPAQVGLAKTYVFQPIAQVIGLCH